MTKLSRAKAPSYPEFRAHILAPLPSSAEPVEDKAYLRRLRDDMQARWVQSMTFVHMAEHNRSAAHYRVAIARRTYDGVISAMSHYEATDRGLWAACDRQMRIPAATKSALKWKCDTRAYNGGHPDWEAAIAADEQRLSTIFSSLQRKERGQ